MKEMHSREELFAAIDKGASIVLFSADWCPDCVFIKPFMPEVESKFTQFEFLYADRDKLIEVCQELDIFGIPSFVAFKDGKEIGRYVNKDRKTQEQIEQFISELSI
ncbi:thioredoxin family protein [Fictibacillus aquaticus]|uniref:Thiol reductase thioredoxin n=1 Tax=Fictibacillus aquaticus TaxID=2021314 RepID=A0A235FA74_9BACL|nr:thioredoxin family protein [Fictibacillus aquaticus]OYD58241.1 thiol reductase thioredoxin [Fictibacillus aquaticus]